MKKNTQSTANFYWQLLGATLALFFVGGLLPAAAAEPVDTDGDGFDDAVEMRLYHTDPTSTDTDGDGFDDYQEIYDGYSPRHAEPLRLSALDSDSDGAPDSWEIRLGLDLLSADTDGDGFSDREEIDRGYDPRSNSNEPVEKKISVSLAQQQLSYSFDGVELDRFAVSTGVRSMPTPAGSFTVLDKVPSKTYGGYGYNFYYPDTKWNLHFTTQRLRYYIHGAYWHNNFGQPMSHGCVNVSYLSMERLYEFAEVGTKVEII